MLKFDNADSCFNCRSVAVIIHNGHILLHRNIEDSFWALPGGRVELFENSDSTISRELLEELDVVTVVKRHIWYVENFFVYAGKKYHEISNYFLTELAASERLPIGNTFRGIESDIELEFKWYPIGDLSNLNLKPAFLKSELQAIPEETKYIKVNDISS
ncbi:hypothetical protein N473_08700 [Pseudoalteromonas luteoviolacea CPMOR-1]|uniref:Nudix hydrolase domain-containing protein n=1 Tax=Pseudoalteromonas luteoviolacea CPMOR-1 TaxID=1365248 RepID=A0A167MIE1_9GAMM|nr:NUDIX hydrolase [Pseudoalteromonas luteoviolacea]KZN66460.1 hypothetical protein N473_08700 [Pseudoalteromonas luteoviolacea CPMOR-1]